MPFPPIREQAKQYLDEPVREVYVFKDPDHDSSRVPVVLYFPLHNKDFREFKSPGILRETTEEKMFGDFKIFDDTNDFASWRFLYPNLSYDRLTSLMEFNVLNNIDVIIAEINEIIASKKSNQRSK